jgi:hypothetical protein
MVDVILRELASILRSNCLPAVLSQSSPPGADSKLRCPKHRHQAAKALGQSRI